MGEWGGGTGELKMDTVTGSVLAYLGVLIRSLYHELDALHLDSHRCRFLSPTARDVEICHSDGGRPF